MKLKEAFAPATDLWLSIKAAFRPTLNAILGSPMLVFRPRAISRLIFYHVWRAYGNAANEAGHQVKMDLITPNAKGVVLDIGAGLGHVALYLSPKLVTKYVALEPNVLMHPHIRDTAARAGFSEESNTLLILSCGAENFQSINSALDESSQGGTVDTIISILTFCSVPSPEQTIELLAHKVLKPGGQFLFYEHVASKRRDVRFWQRLWSPIWKTCFDGCVLYRPTDDYIRNLKNAWDEFPAVDAAGRSTGIWGKEGEDEESLWWHQVGRLIKRST